MTIYINGRFLLQNQTGINRFAYELCKALQGQGYEFVLICPYGTIKDCYDVSPFRIVRFGWGRSHFWEQFFLPLYFCSRKGEKLLVNFSGIGPVFVKNKLMTIHDLAFLHNPDWYSKSYRTVYKILTPLAAKYARRILTVSEFSKSEISRYLNIKDNKISVVHNAVSKIFLEEDNVDYKDVKNEKYVLAVSSVDPRKNFINLIKAFALVKDTDLKLYIIGGESKIYSMSVEDLSHYGKTNSIKWLGRVADNELREYYKNALCFIYPSLYEGFGIPPLEAMACGAPTIVSEIPPLREVCGDAALYVNPYNIEDIADKISGLVNDEALRVSLRNKGFDRQKLFGWDCSSRMVQSIICSLQTDVIEE